MVDTPIGTNSPNYTLVSGDVGATIFCRVTATNASGSAQAFSNAVGPVAAAGGAVPGITTAPAVTVAVGGASVSCNTGTWTNSPTGYAYQWYSDETPDVPIPGATSATYVIDGGVIAAPGPTPPVATNLYMWLLAGAGTFQDDAMTTPATADNTVLGGWQDQGGGGKHFTQATTGNKPKLRTGVLNSLPVIRFTGASAHVLAGSTMAALTAGEIFIVVKATNDPGLGSGADAQMWYMGATNDDHYYPYSDTLIYDGWGSTTRDAVGAARPSLTSFRLYNIVSVAGEWTLFLDGTQIYTTATNTVGFTATPFIGRSFTGSGNFDGDVAEVLMYSAKCSGGDKTTIKNYFATKYALTIA